MSIRIILSYTLVLLALILAFIPSPPLQNRGNLAASQLLKINNDQIYISALSLADMIIQKDPSLVTIDLRAQKEFKKFHIPGAVHMKADQLTNNDMLENWQMEGKLGVLYSTGSVESSKAWLLLRQAGFEDFLVLKGGINSWFSQVMHPKKPTVYSDDEEIAKYSLRQGASQAFNPQKGGLTPITSPATAPTKSAPFKKRKKRKKRKAPNGGC